MPGELSPHHGAGSRRLPDRRRGDSRHRFAPGPGEGRGQRSPGAPAAYQRARQDVGRAILLGLEVLIIADIVLTITVEQTVESALTLGLIVLVRTFLSFSLEIELEGALPWRRGSTASRPAAGPAKPLATEGDGRGDQPG